MRHLIIFLSIILFVSCSVDTTNKDVLLGTVVASNESHQINWMSIQEAEKAMLKTPKSMFVMVHANWCSNSKKFKETTFLDPDVIQMLNKDYYPVKLNAHEPYDIAFKGETFANPNYDAARGLNKQNSYHELLFELEAESVPSTVFLNKDRIVVGTQMGYKNPTAFKQLLGEYKNR